MDRCKNEIEKANELERFQVSLAKGVEHMSSQLNDLYQMNIIFPDFRGNVQTAYLYKYLASGICTELTGPNGAYAQYLMDERTERIVHKLDIIIKQLSQVIINQYSQMHIMSQMYNTLLSTEEELGAVNQTLGDIKREVNKLVENTVDANQYLNDIGKKLIHIGNSLDVTAVNTYVQAMNQYRVEIENGVSSYYLKYPKLCI